MRISILALGARGDVQPYVALGRALQESGHHVRVVTFENFEALVAGQSLEFSPVKGDAQALMSSVSGVQMMQVGRNPFRTMRLIMRTFGAIIDDYIEGFSAVPLMDSEAIINQLPASLFGYDLAEKLRVPHIIASVIPLERTGQFPLSLLSAKSWGTPLNYLTYRFAAQLAWQPFRRAINRFRQRLGLPSASFFGHMGATRRRRDPVINGFSPLVVPPPADWGANVHTTGYWFLSEPQWQPSAELLNFLEAGKPPVFIGFGSMPLPNPEHTVRLILDALRISGQRGVISRGWVNLGSEANDPNIFYLDYAPYTWLFPRMAAIVHHGGSGTTALALTSGVPSLVVAFGMDQPYWGKRVAALEAGPEPIPFKALTSETLAGALQRAVNDPALRQGAAQIGAALHREDGLGKAVEVLSRYLATHIKYRNSK